MRPSAAGMTHRHRRPEFPALRKAAAALLFALGVALAAPVSADQHAAELPALLGSLTTAPTAAAARVAGRNPQTVAKRNAARDAKTRTRTRRASDARPGQAARPAARPARKSAARPRSQPAQGSPSPMGPN